MTRPAEPTVVVAGRPNVGKSTLVNRLLGRRQAISHESPGVTRDRIRVNVRWANRSFALVDTGGVIPSPGGIHASVARQAWAAMENADLVLLVVDTTVGITADDESLAGRLRTMQAPVLVVANKVDSESQEPLAAEFNALGLGEPIPVSALHGRGSGDLLDRVLNLIPSDSAQQPADELRFCVVGRPNVGKSSLFNRLVREERAVVHEQPGTTRDSVDDVVEVAGHTIRFVDTAGFRRPTKTEGVEYYGLVRSIRAIHGAHVALLVIEAPEGVTGEDKRVVARVAEAGRGLVVALNKWDLVESGRRAGRFVELSRSVALLPGTPVVRTSALTGSGVKRIVPALLVVHAAWTRRVPTAEVNRVLATALAANPPPPSAGRIRYATQVSAGPPRFVLFGAPDPGVSYRRYLENSLRKAFGFGGVPVRVTFRPRGDRAGRDRSGGGG